MKFVRFITLLLVLAGAINWGLWGFAKYDFIAHLFNGNTTILARICYSIIGLAGVYSLRLLFSSGVYGKCSCKTSSTEEPPNDEPPSVE
jgi:uncharacterized protein